MKILLPIWLRTHWEPVEAEIVDVAPHLAMVTTFAVYRLPWDDPWWRIANVETGMCISTCDARTKESVIELARLYCARKTQSDIRTGYRRALQAYPEIGRSNDF